MVNPADILLVEDNPSDVHLTRLALRGSPLASRLHAVEDGEQALAFLRREGLYAEAPRPDIIILDLNLPGMDGRHLLMELKSDPDLKTIPVVVLTHSTARADVAECYEGHANCYVVKPLDFDAFESAIREVERFWLRLATLPAGD